MVESKISMPDIEVSKINLLIITYMCHHLPTVQHAKLVATSILIEPNCLTVFVRLSGGVTIKLL